MKTMKKATSLVLGAAIAAVSTMGLMAPVMATDADDAQVYTKPTDVTGGQRDLMSTLNTIINVIIGVIGFVAVVVIILGGVQYTTSAGASDKVANAKNTILYGIIGLVIALLAFAIVNFVLSNVFGS